MKKLALAFLLSSSLIGVFALPLIPVAHADGDVPPGGHCTTDNDCQGDNYGCYPEGNGTCTLWGDPTGGNSGGGANGLGNGAVGSNQPFVPLTDIPAFSNFNPSSGLPVALNSLYYICIGIAVVIAVLQLARAGITYMLADSITSKEEARHLIGASILGLVLVLSPYLVFKLINPSILSLNINVSNLAVNVNGSNGAFDANSQGGLTQQQEENGAKALFDGQYMDFLEFDGTDADAYKAANGYTCQTTQQTDHKVFNNGGHAPYFVHCVTPKVTYQIIAGGSYLTTQDQTIHDTFSGECHSISNAQTDKGFGGYNLSPDQNNGVKTPCGNGQQCYQGFVTCTQ